MYGFEGFAGLSGEILAGRVPGSGVSGACRGVLFGGWEDFHHRLIRRVNGSRYTIS